GDRVDASQVDAARRRTDEDQQPGDAVAGLAVLGKVAIAPAASSPASASSIGDVGELDLNLTRFQPRNHVLDRAWQGEQRSASIQQLVEDLLKCLADIFAIQSEELACVGRGDIDKIKLWSQPGRNADQRSDSAACEGELGR